MLNDLRAAIRLVRRKWAFTAVAVAMLALGIAANITAFGLVRAVLFEPQPYRAPHNIFQVLHADHMARSPFQTQDLEKIAQIPSIARVAGCYSPSLPTLRTYPALLASATAVTEDFFTVFDAKPHLGRVLRPSDFRPGALNAVISFDLWEVRFGRSPHIVGQLMPLNGKQFRILGVMPLGFAPPCLDDQVRQQAWIPFDPAARSRVPEAALALAVRLRGDDPLAEVQARLDAYGIRRVNETGDASYAGIFLEGLGTDKARAARPGLILLQTFAACLLLIACANLGTLFLLDVSRRELEFLTRAFVGASPWRIGSQLLVESTVVATLGGAIGSGISFLIGSAMRSSFSPVLPRGVTYRLAVRDVAVGMSAGILISLIFASVAAFIIIRRTREAAGRTQAHGTTGPSIRRFQDALVATQIGFSVVLAVATTVIGISYIKVATTQLAVHANDVATAVVYLPPGSPPSMNLPVAQRVAVDALHRSDNTLDIALSDTPPFAGGVHARVELDSAKVPRRPSISANIRRVTPNYFDVLNIPVRRGRAHAPSSDTDLGEAVASESFVRRTGVENVLGKVVRIGVDRSYRVVGIASDVPTVWLWQAGEPTLYIALDRAAAPEFSVLARSSHAATTTAIMQEQLTKAFPQASAVAAESLAKILWRSERQRTFYLASVAGFALAAVLIAAVGAFTTVRCMVELRGKEFAIRMALGAAPNRLQTEIFMRALLPVAGGVAAGLMAALWLARVVSSLEHTSVIVGVIMRTSPDVVPTTMAVAFATLLLSALASGLPARRAALVDPANLLKSK